VGLVRFLPHVWAPDGSVRLIANDKNTLGDVMYFLAGVIRDRLERQKDERKASRFCPIMLLSLPTGLW
jgi:S-DNA-T family DNA segregation ATPase FtsK/SpoIIIE